MTSHARGHQAVVVGQGEGLPEEGSVVEWAEGPKVETEAEAEAEAAGALLEVALLEAALGRPY